MKKLLLMGLLGLTVPAPAWADGISDQVVSNLQSQGYTVLEMDRTWLGRIWILAENGTVRREVVFNPGTGEILRDYAVLISTLPDEEKANVARLAAEHDHGGNDGLGGSNLGSTASAAARVADQSDGSEESLGSMAVAPDAGDSDVPTAVPVDPIDPVQP